jgi:hypothetical protein
VTAGSTTLIAVSYATDQCTTVNIKFLLTTVKDCAQVLVQGIATNIKVFFHHS